MSDRRDTADVLVGTIAARQYGAVSVEQLRRAGLDKHAVLHRMRIGRLHRVHRNVYAAGHSALSPKGLWMAAILAIGSSVEKSGSRGILDHWGAVISHRGAAELWELLPMRGGPVEVSVAGTAGRSKRAGIRLHRSRTLSESGVTLRERIPVTTPARTIADLRGAVGRGVTAAADERELRRAIRQANVLGLPVDEEARRDRTRSDLERDFLAVCRRYRLPSPEVNVRVGPHLVDFLWRDRRLAVETDGFASHRGRQAFEDDRARDLDLRRRGWSVIRLSEKQVDEEPERIAETLAAALRVGADGRREKERR